MKDTLTINITGHCARCDGKHEGLVFKRMIGEPVEAIDGIYRYWAMCPNAKQPIVLMRGEECSTHPKLLEAQMRADKSRALIGAISRRLTDAGLEEWKKDIMGGAQILAREFLEERDKLKARIQKCKKGHEYLADSHEYPCPTCQLEEYGPDYVDELQQRIDERNVEISNIKEVMTQFHDDHVYGTHGTEGFLRPCCRVDEREDHLPDCRVGEIIGNTPPPLHAGDICPMCQDNTLIAEVDPHGPPILSCPDCGVILGDEHRNPVFKKENDGHEVGELTPENATVMWKEGDEPPPGVDPGGSILGHLPDSTGGDEESGSPAAEGIGEEDRVGDGGEQEEGV
jgi:hypothetical protein